MFILSLTCRNGRTGIKPRHNLNLHNLPPYLVGAQRCLLNGYVLACVRYEENNLAGGQWGCRGGEREKPVRAAGPG